MSNAAAALFDLTGKTAIVTGSSRGIGRAIAETLSEAGANVVVCSRKLSGCDEVVEGIKAKGGKALAVQANVSEKSELEHLVKQTRETFGPVDIMVGNAASNPHFGPMSTCTDDQFDKIMNNNVKSNLWLANMVADDMAAKGDGAIIIVSSVLGLRGSFMMGPYSISKAADIQLVRCLAIELGPKGIRVNGLAPGLIKTDFSKALWSDDKTRTRVERGIPMRRMGEPEDMGGVALFLASKAARYLSGEIIVADGGMTITDGMA